MANKKTNKTKPTPATKKDSKPVVKSENKKEVEKKPATDNKSKTTAKTPVVKKKRTALKATLITLASVLGAGALGVGGYYLWNNFEVSPAQPAVDKEIQAVIYMMNALNENSTKADFDAADKAYKALTVKQQERLKKQEAYEWYLYQNNLYDNDVKNVNEFLAKASELIPETCKTDEINKVRKLRDDVDEIRRGQDFTDKITEAQGYLATALASYEADAQIVNDLVSTVSTPDFVSSSNKEGIKNAGTLLDKAKKANVNRNDPDFAEKIKDGEVKIKTAEESLKNDTAKIANLKTVVNALKSKSTECTADEIANVEKQYETDVKSIHNNRKTTDFKEDLATMTAAIEEVKNKYNIDAVAANEFTGLVDKLDDTSSDEDIKEAEGKRSAAEAIVRKDLKDKVDAASEALNKHRADYTNDAANAKKFTDAVDNLAKISSPTQENINVAADLKEDAIKIARTDLKDDISAAATKLKEIQGAYDADAKTAHEFTDLVDKLDSTSSNKDIEAAEKQESAAQLIAREDLAKEVDDAAEALAVHRASYDVDAENAKKFTDAASLLGPTSSKSDIAAAGVFEPDAQAVVRTDLTAAVDLASAKLKGLQDAYAADEKIAHAFTDLASKLDDTSSIDEIEAAESKQSAAQNVKQLDLVAEVESASTILSTQKSQYPIDKANADAFTGAVADLDSNSSKDEIDSAAALEEEAQKVKRKDLTAGVDTASDALKAIQSAYETDEESANAVTSNIDNYYTAASITAENINNLNASYLALSKRAKGIADATCATNHDGLDVPGVVAKMNTEFAMGSPVNSLINDLNYAVSYYDTTEKQMYLLSVISDYDKIASDTADHPFALKAILATNQGKITTLKSDMSNTLVSVYDSSSIAGPEVTQQPTRSLDNTYGYLSKITVDEPAVGSAYVHFLTIPQKDVALLKDKYSKLIFIISHDDTSGGAVPNLKVMSWASTIGEATLEYSDTPYNVEVNMNNAGVDYDITFQIIDAEPGSHLFITDIYGIPK